MAGGGYDIGASFSNAQSSAASQSGSKSFQGGLAIGTTYGPGAAIINKGNGLLSGSSFSWVTIVAIGVGIALVVTAYRKLKGA